MELLARHQAASLVLTALFLFVASALMTSVLIVYARRHLIDLPGQRRSHLQPTPRGGGFSFAVVLIGYVLLGQFTIELQAQIALALALLIVAAVGFWDDHRPLAPTPKLAAHGIAALLVTAGLWPYSVTGGSGMLALAASVAFCLALIWSINLHNFMDGINGLLALQSVFIAVLVAMTAAIHADATLLRSAVCTAAAVLGFLPFNFPHARIFMGDVGSNVLGLWIGVLLALAVSVGALSLPQTAAAVSAFTIDATLTLLTRMRAGRRWYSAHREHLYQWLARSGSSQAFVVILYMLWNMLVVVPAIQSMARVSAVSAWIEAGMLYALGGAIWWLGKRACLSRARTAKLRKAIA